MLENKEKNNPEAIEIFFCKEFEKMKSLPLSVENFGFLYTLGTLNQEQLQNLRNIPEAEKPFIIKLIEKRVEVCFDYTIELDPRVKFIVATLGESPGKAVMLLTYIQYKCFKLKIKDLTYEDLMMKIFPIGVPSDEDLNKLWNMQKIDNSIRIGLIPGSDNLLDYPDALKSIRF